MLIGLTGLAGTGKDTVAGVLSEHHNFYSIAFADPLKEAAAAVFGLSIEHFYEVDLKEVVDGYWGMSPRTMLQKLGTDACRNIIDPQIWVKVMQRNSQTLLEEGENVVITDVRFENEAAVIREMGGTVVHITSNRQSALNQDNQKHVSESGVKFLNGDCLLSNDKSLKHLKDSVDFLHSTLKDLNA